MDVRTSPEVLQILQNPQSRREFYRAAWRGGGEVHLNGRTYEIVSSAQSVARTDKNLTTEEPSSR